MASWFGGGKDDDAKKVGEDMQKLSEQIGELQQKLTAKTSEADSLRNQASQNAGSSVALEDANAQLEVLRNQIAEMKVKAEQAAVTKAAPAPTILGELSTHSAPASPAAEGSKSSAPSAPAGGLASGSSAWVTRAGGLPLRLRSAPSLQGDILDRLQPGTEMTLTNGPQQADGHGWWQIRTSDGRTGWVAGEDLRTQPD